MALAQLSIDIIAKMAKFEEDLRKASDSTKGFRDKVTAELEGLKSSANKFALGAAGSMAAAFSIHSIAEWVNHTAEAADELNRLSHQTGVSVEALSAWGNIAKRNGQDVNDLAELIQELSLRLTETDKSTEGTGLALKQLGLNYKDLAKMDAEKAFKTVAQSLAGVEDSGKKTAMVMAIMGDEGQKYLTTLNAIGAAGALVPTVLTEQSKAAKRYLDSVAELKNATDAWSQSIVSGITPTLADLNTALADVILGTAGAGKKARELASNTAIAEWVGLGVKALTYLSDALQVVGRAIFVTISTIDTAIKSVAVPIVGVFHAAAAAMTGDFEEAGKAIEYAIGATDERTKQWTADVSNAFSDQLFGSAVRDRMDEVHRLGKEVDDAGDKAKSSSKNFSLVAQNSEEYKKLIQGIRDKIVAMQQEQAVGAQLTSAEQERLTTMRQLADGRTKMSVVQRAAIRATLDELVMVEALTTAKREISKVDDQNRATEREVDGYKVLTSAQQAALQWMERLRDGRIKLTEAQKVEIAGQWEQALATEQALEAQKRMGAWLDEARGLNADVIEQGAAKVDDLKAQIKAQREQNQEFGLSVVALGELQRARELEKAAALEAKAAAMDELDSHAALVQQWRDQADAIRELVGLQRDQAEMQRKNREDPYAGAREGMRGYLEELNNAGAAAERFAADSLRGVEDELTKMATGGKADWKSLVDTMLAESMRLGVIRPLLRQLYGDGGIGSTGGQVAGWLGSLAGGFKSGGSGGGVDSFNSWEVDAGFRSASSGGGSWLSSVGNWASSLFGRANGGPVQSGQLYNVNERGPELLTVGNRTMLMMGSDSGVVTPLQSTAGGSSGGAAGSVTVQQNFYFNGADGITRDDLRRTAAEAKQAALAEFADMRSRGVRGYA